MKIPTDKLNTNLKTYLELKKAATIHIGAALKMTIRMGLNSLLIDCHHYILNLVLVSLLYS